MSRSRIRRTLTLRERLFPPSYRCYPWWMPDDVGRYLDRVDRRRAERLEDPASVSWLVVAGDRLGEVALATVGSLILFAGASVLVLALGHLVRVLR